MAETRAISLRSVCKISGETIGILSEYKRVVLVNNTVTYFNLCVYLFKQRDMSVMTRVPIFIFSTLCVVHDQTFQRKLSRRRLPVTFVYFVSHASAQALRPIRFTQRFRTTRHLFSIQLLWKPEILNVEDKQTKFERSKGSSFRIMQIFIDTSAIEQTHGFALFLRCWWMKATDIPAG